MALSIFERQMRLLAMLTRNTTLSVEALGEKLGLGRRQMYRYIEVFKDYGMEFQNKGSVYRLLPSSPFFRDLTEGTYFSADEAQTLHHLVSTIPHPSPRLRHIQRKLAQQFRTDMLAVNGVDEQAEMNMRNLLSAIEKRQQVVLHNYRSNNSGKTSDRLVEPYCIIHENNLVRCYEVATHTPKSFSLTRMESVEVLQQEWQYAQEHTKPLIDVFGYASDTPQPVTLRMTRRAYQLFQEEFPQGRYTLPVNVEQKKAESGEDVYMVSTHYCHNDGIARFVMGLIADVRVIGAPQLVEFIQGVLPPRIELGSTL